MDAQTAIIFSTAAYKLACLAVGSLFCAFGYLLFKRGIWGTAGDLDAKFSNSRLVLKSAAPGIFFALFGAGIVMLTVWQGLKFEVQERSASSNDGSADAPSLPDGAGGSK